jgi:hypothetical protein
LKEGRFCGSLFLQTVPHFIRAPHKVQRANQTEAVRENVAMSDAQNASSGFALRTYRDPKAPINILARAEAPTRRPSDS